MVKPERRRRPKMPLRHATTRGCMGGGREQKLIAQAQLLSWQAVDR